MFQVNEQSPETLRRQTWPLIKWGWGCRREGCLNIITVEIPGLCVLTTDQSRLYQVPGHCPRGSQLGGPDVIYTEQTPVSCLALEAGPRASSTGVSWLRCTEFEE